MNVERTIEFILQTQAKQAAHMDAIDRRMNGVTKLIEQGMRLLVSSKKETDQKINALIDGQLRLEQAQGRTDAALKQLAEAQKVTEKKFQALLHRQGRNGH
jgi:hypothetical protein